MDITQIVLLSVIIVLSIFLVVLGVQVFFVLKSLKKTLKKVDTLFTEANQLVAEVKKPISRAGSIVTALTTGATIMNLLKKVKDERSGQK